jgi:hypothetical protein
MELAYKRKYIRDSQGKCYRDIYSDGNRYYVRTSAGWWLVEERDGKWWFKDEVQTTKK